MKLKFRWVVFWLALLSPLLHGAPRDARWRDVDQAIRSGLPKSAIEQLQAIAADALHEKSYPEAVRAIAHKIALGDDLEGGSAEDKIRALESEMKTLPAAVHPVMEVILAHWYWDYFQQNRWKFAQRTQTAGTPGADLQTWDLPTILAAIDQHFSAAIADAAALQRIPIGDYDALLNKGTAPDAYRPTLYDFLVYEALQFYQTGEQAAIAGEDEVELDAHNPIFGDTEEFLRWQPTPVDASSPVLKSIHLYQTLLAFHQHDPDRSAYYDADLARIVYGHNVAKGDDATERYTRALTRFVERTRHHEVPARALAALAQERLAEGEPAQAHEIAQHAVDSYSPGVGAAQCADLLRQLEAPLATVATENVWNSPSSTIDVTYRNVTKIYLRAVPARFEATVAQFWRYDDHLLNTILSSTPALAWNATLPPTPDFKLRVERLPAPTTLPPGLYYIVASHDPAFSKGHNQLSLATVWVSDLALVLQQSFSGTEHSGLVLNAITGEPVAGARVKFWVGKPGSEPHPGPTTMTDANGRFAFTSENEVVVVLAEHGLHAVSTMHPVYTNRWGRPESQVSRTIFFTDRSLYRPGQTIHYKGVCIRAEQANDKYSARRQMKVTVVLKDQNGQELARADHVTNDYGSFSGEFTAPRGRLTGSMLIQSLSPEGAVSVSVEEYKRPKFLVELNAPADAPKLDAPVSMTGHATAYTGAAIGNAKVKWRVERAVQFPRWCWWARPLPSKAIAHGVAFTAADGTFIVNFTAQPDRATSPKTEPKFSYTVYADVTDTTGETRSAERSVTAGYTALEATVETGEWQTAENPVVLRIATCSLDGDPQPAKGVLKIHALQQPATVIRRSVTSVERDWWKIADDPKEDPSIPDTWKLGELVETAPFTSGVSGSAEVKVHLPAGIYRATVETADRFGKTVTSRQTVQVYDPRAKNYAVSLPNQVAAPAWTMDVGQTFRALWGTGYKTGRAFIQLERNGETLQQFWTATDRTQQLVTLPVDESMRGGFTLRITFVRENRAYITERIVDVPWKNKELSVRWETFRSKLEPGKKETWTAIVTGPHVTRSTAEMVATLYDASLDQFQALDWPRSFEVFRREQPRTRSEFQNIGTQFVPHYSWPAPPQQSLVWNYRAFPAEIVTLNQDVITLSPFSVSTEARDGYGYAASATLAGSRMKKTELRDIAGAVQSIPAEMPTVSVAERSEPEPKPRAAASLAKVSPRRNLAETAFFFPQLLTDANGEVKMRFDVPEALTEWRFIGFAHDAELRAGLLTDKAVTSKALMVEPNPPRFLREGDVVEFTVKVSNQSEQSQTGTVRLTLADAASLETMDGALGNRTPDQAFAIPARQSRSFSWRISIPDAVRVLTYKAVASTPQFSDGEEGLVPVLSRRILVTESLPLPIRGQATKQFEFTKLLASAQSPTLQHQSLTVQMTSQPAWYAVLALPYLMEFPHECSEQVFNRFYANALARHIASADPKIRSVFDQWKNTPALESPLTKNQDLKSVVLEETPWLRTAQAETQNRRNVGMLFDAPRLDEEATRALRTLAERQNRDGLWSWFPGGPSSEYITLYITTGFGRLRHLQASSDVAPAIKSLDGLDAWMTRRYHEILKSEKPDEYVPSSLDALYLYMRSFFLADRPISAENQAAVQFFRRRAAEKWLALNSLQSQAHLALGLQRFGDRATAQAILRSLKERSLTSEEMGRYWPQPARSWWWYDAPIETQAVLIEAFAEVAHDDAVVEDAKVWLLKQKQTQDWRTTKATADAVYSLLLTGRNLLASDALVTVALDGKPVQPEHVEAGTGFYEKTISSTDISPAMGHITVTKTDDGVSWGSVHWQYLEDMSRVTPHEGTPLKLRKELFVKETTTKGQVLQRVDGPIRVGDELVVRLELRTDRDMEFVHLKDQRGSGVEPVDVLSRYQYRDGLGYYESTRDTATHFFIDYLPKGTYVFEYSTRVQLKGEYQSGIAEIQCMYAPEFNSHSESYRLEVK